MTNRLYAGVRSLAAQLGALALAGGMALAGQTAFHDASFNLWALAGMQGMLAAMLGLALGLAWWWLPINLAFLPAVLLVQQTQLPAVTYLAGFLVLLAFNWGVIRTRVPLYLSRRAVWEQVAGQLPADRPYTFIDIGSGLGGMTLYLGQARPNGIHDGVEISPAPWLVSRIRALMRGARTTFTRGDYRQLDLSGYDVVFAFLSPLVMRSLLVKASREMRPGTLLLSLAFPLPGVEHDIVLQTGNGKRQTLYGWRIRPGCGHDAREDVPRDFGNAAS
jgi:SAM-dependent methyltransferase